MMRRVRSPGASQWFLAFRKQGSEQDGAGAKPKVIWKASEIDAAVRIKHTTQRFWP